MKGRLVVVEVTESGEAEVGVGAVVVQVIGSGEGERQTRDGGSAGGREGERRTYRRLTAATTVFASIGEG